MKEARKSPETAKPPGKGPMRATLTLAVILTAVLPRAVASTAPQDPPQPWCLPGHHQGLAFPLQTAIPHSTLAAHCFVPTPQDRARVQALRNYRCVRLQGLTLPGAAVVDLELTRINDLAPKFLSLDGAGPGTPNALLPTPMSLWSGSIPGIADSRACIAFSEVGVWGWIATNTQLFHLTSFPSAGSWANYRTLLVADAHKNLLGGWQCGDPIVEPPTLPPTFSTCLSGLARSQWSYQCPDPGITQLRLCRAAVETDYQFYQRFGDWPAAEVYARFVLGNVAQALRLDVRVVVELEYLGLWTTAADPWLEQDLVVGQVDGPCCVDVFYEFQHKWGTEDLIFAGPRFDQGPGLGLAPVAADLYHLMSGVQMGCAIGLRGVGTANNGFSISTGMGAISFGNANEPRASPFFQIYGAGHEIGHSFGVGHTHAFKIDVLGTPSYLGDDVPIDNCGVDPSGGAASCAGVAFGQSTLMSYCICPPAGLGNIRIQYHPEMARCMRAYTIALPDYDGVHFVTDLGNASAPTPATPPELRFTGYSSGPNSLTLTGLGNPPVYDANALVVGLFGAHTVMTGFTIVPSFDITLIDVSPGTPLDIPLPVGFPNGLMAYFQQAFLVNSTDVYTSNAIAFEVIR
jgi:hypothetical protein